MGCMMNMVKSSPLPGSSMSQRDWRGLQDEREELAGSRWMRLVWKLYLLPSCSRLLLSSASMQQHPHVPKVLEEKALLCKR